MDHDPPRPGKPRIHNRLKAFLIHTPWYSFQGQCRLAADCRVACSSISRLARNEISPSYALARLVTDAVSCRLGVEIDAREIFSTDGTYPTPCVCDLTPFCRGCFPPDAYGDDDGLLPEYSNKRPGDWCRYPQSPPRPTRSTHLPLTPLK